MEFTIEPKTVLLLAVEKLRTAIISGSFTPGERLVATDLCERLGISRPSLREALRVLEAEKLVVITPNRGPSVAKLSWEQAQQIYLVRALLEGEASFLCAKNASDEEVAHLARVLKAFADSVKTNDAEARIRNTAEFYEILQSASGNQIINEILQGLVSRINVLRTQSMADGTRAWESLKEMSAIYEAISTRNPEAARRASTLHVNNAAIAAKAALLQVQQDRNTH